MSISANFPNVRPSLLLDFANSQQLDPRVTFSRSTTAPYYDGKTSVLAEQNLLLQSNTFTDVVWQKANGGVGSVPSVTANYATAPDGTNTASRVQYTLNGGITTSDISSLRQAITKDNTLTYTWSFYAKSTDGTSNYAMLGFGANPAGDAITVTGSWQRFVITGSGTNQNIGILIRGGQTPTNANSADILLWNVQLEQRSSVTAYNATTTSALTNYIPQLLTAPINQPRFDFNPTTGESLGLLIEQSSTNLQTYSQDFSNSLWTKGGATITSASNIAPDGTQTMQALVEDTSTGSHRIFTQNAIVVSTSTATTYTIYAKSAGRTIIQLANNELVGAYFDLSSGTVTSGTGTITPVGNGVYRCTISVISSTVNGRLAVYLVSTGTTTSYTGNGYSGVYIWGAQLEALAFSTSYIPTTSAQVTRASDNASMTGTNFSSWYNNAQGTLFSEVAVYNTSANAMCVATLSDGTSSNRMELRPVSSAGSVNSRLYVATNNSAQADIQTGTTVVNTFQKISAIVQSSNFILSVAGASGTTVTTGQIPSVNQLTIGNSPATLPLSGRIKKLAYYPQVVTQTQNQALTGS